MRINHTLFFLSISILLITRYIFIQEISSLILFIIIFIFYIYKNFSFFIILDLFILLVLIFISLFSYFYFNIYFSGSFIERAFRFFIKKDWSFFRFFIFNQYTNSSLVKQLQELGLYHIFIVSGFHLNFLSVFIFKKKNIKSFVLNLIFYLYIGVFLFSSLSYLRVLVSFIISIFTKKRYTANIISFIVIYILFLSRNLHSYSLLMSYCAYLLVYYLNKIIKNKLLLFITTSFFIQSLYCLSFSFISGFGLFSFLYSYILSYFIIFYYIFTILFFYIPFANNIIYFLADYTKIIISYFYTHNLIIKFIYNINIISYVFCLIFLITYIDFYNKKNIF
jgi:competence protein ComEC